MSRIHLSTNAPRLIRRLDTTVLTLAQHSSAISYSVGMFYLETVRNAIIQQRFPVQYRKLSGRYIRDKGHDRFWTRSDKLLGELFTTVPEVVKSGGNQKSYRIRFSSYASRVIYYNEVYDSPDHIQRPLFRPIYEDMVDVINKMGRKAIQQVRKDIISGRRTNPLVSSYRIQV